MWRVRGFTIETNRLIKFLAVVALTWIPPMSAVMLLVAGWVSSLVAIVIGLVGAAAGIGLVTARAMRYRHRPLTVQGTDVSTAAWVELANPRENYANRWAMYEDLTAALARRDWSKRVVGEFGGTNEVLRAFMRGAEHRIFGYPDYDIQNLGKIPDAALDVAVLDQTLEHVEDPERALREVHRVLRPKGLAIVTTPFLVPVHTGETYGDYYRWTPQGMAVMLRRCGFTADVRMWGNSAAAAALLGDMYMTAEAARLRGLTIGFNESDATFPISVWAIAEKMG